MQPNGDLILGGNYGLFIDQRTRYTQPALWAYRSGAWQPPITYAVPGQTAYIMDVNGAGQAIGSTTFADGTIKGVIWDGPSTYTLVDDILRAINGSGTLAVGLLRSGGAGFWYRDPATGGWNRAPIPLPSGEPSCNSDALDVNDAGVVVGYGCPATSQKKVSMGMVWRIDASSSPPRLVSQASYLPGLDATTGGKAVAISNVAPFVIVGEAPAAPKRLAVRWTAP